jgi:hypothetical protein
MPFISKHTWRFIDNSLGLLARDYPCIRPLKSKPAASTLRACTIERGNCLGICRAGRKLICLCIFLIKYIILYYIILYYIIYVKPVFIWIMKTFVFYSKRWRLFWSQHAKRTSGLKQFFINGYWLVVQNQPPEAALYCLHCSSLASSTNTTFIKYHLC